MFIYICACSSYLNKRFRFKTVISLSLPSFNSARRNARGGGGGETCVFLKNILLNLLFHRKVLSSYILCLSTAHLVLPWTSSLYQVETPVPAAVVCPSSLLPVTSDPQGATSPNMQTPIHLGQLKAHCMITVVFSHLFHPNACHVKMLTHSSHQGQPSAHCLKRGRWRSWPWRSLKRWKGPCWLTVGWCDTAQLARAVSPAWTATDRGLVRHRSASTGSLSSMDGHWPWLGATPLS